MKRTNYVLTFIISIFIVPQLVSADCSYARKSELSKIASNVQLSYTYEINSDKIPVFIVNISNINDDIYAIEKTENIIVHEREREFSYTTSGETITFDIFSNDNNCLDEKIMTRYISLPNYNQFNLLEDCKDYPHFKYCKLWQSNKGLTTDKFYDDFYKYLSSDVTVENTKMPNRLLTFLYNNISILIITFIGLAILIFLIIKYRKR